MPFWKRNSSRPSQQQPTPTAAPATEGPSAAEAEQTHQCQRLATEPGVGGAAARGGASGVAKGIGISMGMWVWSQAKDWFGIDEG